MPSSIELAKPFVPIPPVQLLALDLTVWTMDGSAAADSIGATETRLTDLEIESRVRHLLGRRTAQLATAPVDVEAVLEIPAAPHQSGVRLEIISTWPPDGW